MRLCGANFNKNFAPMKYLISTAELLAEPSTGIVVFDCRFNLMDKHQGEQQYQKGHIPGAYYLNLETQMSSPVAQHGGRHPLPDLNDFAHYLKEAGVNQHTMIVLYDDSRMAYAARAWWLLQLCGHTNVKILNGGFTAWIAAGGAIDRRTPAKKAGNFKLQVQQQLSIDRTEIVQQHSNLTLVDSREEKRFLGKEEPIDPIAGHIPEALNYFWQEVTDEKGFMKSVEFQQARWQIIKNKNNIVIYCGSGVTACVNLLSLSICGIDAKLYPGSWSDWCSYL
jgi:thiosulfate/3-mercaptopyruvate sulfurtransferase